MTAAISDILLGRCVRYDGERPQQLAWIDAKLRAGGEDALSHYVAERSAVSIDGLPGLERKNLGRTDARA